MKNSIDYIKQLFNKKHEVFNYEDFDTDDSEDLDLTPEWLKDRNAFDKELEECITMNKNIIKIPIKRGSLRENNIQNFWNQNS